MLKEETKVALKLEMHFDEINAEGSKLLSRKTMIWHSGHSNWCPAMWETWKNHWNIYNPHEALDYLPVQDNVLIFIKGRTASKA
jgi:hypothetical protein